MKLLLGLGNYPVEYTKTRHNAGFLFLDYFQKKHDGTSFVKKKELKAEVSECFVDGEKYLLVKPQTYMNLSGQALGFVMKYFDIEKEDVWIIYDDIDMEFGKVRQRGTGRSGGHNGIKSIIEVLQGEDFHRIKIGVSNEQREKIPAEAFVLQRFEDEEWEALPGIFKKVEEQILYDR